MKILLIGASSYLGARLYVDLAKTHEVIGTYSKTLLSPRFYKLDITDKVQVAHVINSVHPDVVIHCANFPKIEGSITQVQGEAVNLKATDYIVEYCNNVGAKLVFISSVSSLFTDNLYGLYKKESEEKVKTAKKGWLILQPPYILGMSPNTTNDRPFNRIYKNIFEKTPAVYDNSWKTPLSYIGQISEVIKVCLEKDIWRQTIMLGTEVKKSRYEMARDILKPLGIDATAIDKKDTTFSADVDLTALRQLGLPDYTYEEIVARIVEEIKNRDAFKIA